MHRRYPISRAIAHVRYPSAASGNSLIRAAAAALLLAWLAALAGLQSANASDLAIVDTDVLNVRSEPGTGSAVLEQMTQGVSIPILDGPSSDGWYKIRYNGVVGWAYRGYLSIDGMPGWTGGTGGGSGGGGTAGGERWIDIDRGSQTVTLIEGEVAIASYWVAMGWDQSDDGFYATASGTYYVYGKNADLTWTPWAQAYIASWVAFDPDRSNGFHAYTMDARGNVLPNGAGPTGGCVALEPSAAQLFVFADYGTRVEIHW